jgi:UrcA family protein
MNSGRFPRNRRPRKGLALPLWAAVAIAFCAPLATPGAMAAETNPEQVRAKVSLVDLNLQTADGLLEARARLRAAARHLCQKVVDYRGTSAAAAHQECTRDALSNAMRQLDTLVRVAKS